MKFCRDRGPPQVKDKKKMLDKEMTSLFVTLMPKTVKNRFDLLLFIPNNCTESYHIFTLREKSSKHT